MVCAPACDVSKLLSDVTYFFSVGSEGKGNEKNGEGRQDRGKEGNGKRDPVPDWQSEKVAS